MSLSLLKKTALLMGDLQDSNAKKKRTSKSEASLGRMVAAKRLNNVKLVKFSTKEKQTRRWVDDMRRKKKTSVADLSRNIARVQKFSEKIDSYSKKALANDVVRQRIFKNQASSFIPLKTDDDDAQQSAFTEEDFKRFEEEYNIKYTARAKERAEIQKIIK